MSEPTARSLDPTESAPMVHAIPFPPLGNRMLVGAVTTDASGDPGLDHVLGLAEELDADAEIELDGEAMGWLSTVVQRANQDTFRAALTGPASDPAPRIERLAAGELGGLDASPLLQGRGTAKLVVVVGVKGDGSATLTLAGASGKPEVRRGCVAIWPSYLVATDLEVKGDLEVLIVIMEGPAWR